MRILAYIKLWLPPALWAGLIYFLSSIPGLATPLSWDFLLRKLAHGAEFAVLTWLIARALSGHKLTKWRVIACSFMLGTLYAVSDEYHQSFVVCRFCSLYDVAIDAFGCVIGLAGKIKTALRRQNA